MMILVWIAAGSFLLGKGLLAVLYSKNKPEDIGWQDAFLTGICLEIGFMEAAHLAALLGGYSLKTAAAVWAAMVLIFCLAVLIFLLAKLPFRTKKRKGRGTPLTAVQQVLLTVFVISVLLQLVFIWVRGNGDRTGDMMMETVRSFLASGEIYGVNPLTGRAYEVGMPGRLKILSLPTLYASLCVLTHTDPLTAVGKIVPAVVLLAAYCAYGLLGKLLFGKDRTKGLLFLLIVSLIFWLRGVMEEMDSFQLLWGGYRGTAIRAGILAPYTIYSCLCRRWRLAVLCILAEACILWTFYGMGACLLITVCMSLPDLWSFLAERWEERGCGDS